MRKIILAFIFLSFISCKKYRDLNFPKDITKVSEIPTMETYVFIMAGQSNMAGRGFVEPSDTISLSNVYTLDKNNDILLAKEPLHYYEPNKTGLDCGLSFATELRKKINDSISILLVPTAIGGTTSQQWVNDSLIHGVKLLSNFREKVEYAKTLGTVKGILWHQGENDANDSLFANHKSNIEKLFSEFRNITGSDTPIFIGEIGEFKNNPYNQKINKNLKELADNEDVFLIKANNLNHKGDKLHFNSEAIRELGKRYAEAYLKVKK